VEFAGDVRDTALTGSRFSLRITVDLIQRILETMNNARVDLGCSFLENGGGQNERCETKTLVLARPAADVFDGRRLFAVRRR
jgi:hypothetical protein